MRILMLSWEYPPHIVGGLGAHVGALAPELARAGVEVRVLTPRLKGGAKTEVIGEKGGKRKKGTRGTRGRKGTRGTKGKSKPQSVVERVNLQSPISNLDFFSDVQAINRRLEARGRELFDAREFDLIHVHDWLVAFAGIALKHAYKTPLLATIHATERGRGRGGLNGETAQAINATEWWLTYEAWRVITTSGFMADEVKSFFQVPSDKVGIVPNGVDSTPFDALGKRDLPFRARWARKDERIVFSVGRVVHEKGAQVLLEAAPHVLAEFPDVKFIVAGTGWLVDTLKRRAVELGIAEKFIVAGFISDDERNRLLKVADVAVFPSLYEPFGIVALEAMAAKCPVVVSEVGGLREVVRHAETGITVYPDNAESLAWGILHTLKHPDWAKQRAARAYRVVQSDFAWKRIAARTKEVYERVVRERKKVTW